MAANDSHMSPRLIKDIDEYVRQRKIGNSKASILVCYVINTGW